MSTVVITPTHVASDHRKVSFALPVEFSTDVNHQKMFISSKNDIVVAVSGSYNSEFLSSDLFFECVRDVVYFLRSADWEKSVSVTSKEGGNVATMFASTIWDSGEIFILTNCDRYRGLMSTEDGVPTIKFRVLGDYFGMGTGGQLAVGLLLGGIRIEDIWDIIPSLDSYSSKEHSIFDLRQLEDVVLPAKEGPES